MFGLFAFFYAVLHFLTYIWLDKFFDWHEILADVSKRRFITVGFTGFVLLIPLALTSTKGWIRRLGGKRWQALHRLIYISAIAGVVHYWWLVKADISKPEQYAFVLTLLLGYRVVVWGLRKTRKERRQLFRLRERRLRRLRKDSLSPKSCFPVWSVYTRIQKYTSLWDNFLRQVVFKGDRTPACSSGRI